MKLTKAQVRYQDYPHQHKRCSQCTMFRAPDDCTLVEGPISKHGYCVKYYAKHESFKTRERARQKGY